MANERLMGELAQAMTAASERFCACGHDVRAHYRPGCSCGCDVRPFEVEQGSVRYDDTGEMVGLDEHRRRVAAGQKPLEWGTL